MELERQEYKGHHIELWVHVKPTSWVHAKPKSPNCSLTTNRFAMADYRTGNTLCTSTPTTGATT